MMGRTIALAALLLGAASADQQEVQSSVTPIQKVLQMMDELKAKAIKEKQEEIDTFNKFTKFCTDTVRAKGYAIKDANAKIEKLKADIQKYDSDVMVLGDEITKLDTDIDVAEKEKAEATEVRHKANADYMKTHADYVDSTEDLAVGINQLKKMMKSTSAASSFIQEMVSRPRLPTTARRVLTSFLATSSKTEELLQQTQQPEEPAFESQSGGIVEMMQKLEDKLAEEKAELEKEEMEAAHAFSMLEQALNNQIKKNTESRSDKAALKKQKEAASAAAKGDLADTTVARDADEKYSADLTALCEQKSADFEIRQQTRKEELEAIDKAVEIIGGDSVAGSGSKHLPTLVQSSFAQLRNVLQQPSQSAAASFLKLQGDRLNSRILSALSLRVTHDPFVKVRKMIKDMVTKLMEEASDEAEHKGWCDDELSENQATRDAKTNKVQELTANIEEMTATSAKLSQDITTLTEEMAAISAAVSKATDIRNEENEKNTATVADAKQAIDAVSRATKVLKDFYDKAAGSTALLQSHQNPADDVPGTFDEPFTGTGGQGGILGMLDVILSDFERLLSETTETESSNKREYDSFMDDSTADGDAKKQDSKDKTRERTKLDHDNGLAKKDLKNTQEELDAALEYYEKLKPSCVDAGVSYEERVARRKEEIESLQEALKILNGEDLA